MFKKLDHPVVYLLLVILFGFGIRHFFLDTPVESSVNSSTQALFAATFPDETGQPQALKKYAGKIVVLNFWATWCAPCREEMPELSKLHSTYQHQNVVVLGLAVDDVTAISDFVKETKVSYPLLAADMQGMEIATHLGNNKGVLPYTVIIKTDGSVAKTYFGRVTQLLLEKTLKTLL